MLNAENCATDAHKKYIFYRLFARALDIGYRICIHLSSLTSFCDDDFFLHSILMQLWNEHGVTSHDCDRRNNVKNGFFGKITISRHIFYDDSGKNRSIFKLDFYVIQTFLFESHVFDIDLFLNRIKGWRTMKKVSCESLST